MPLRFLNPNFHVILIHYPLGVFVLGVMLELFSFFWKRSSVRIAARWMILLGALLSLPAATSGIYALYDIDKHQGGWSPERKMFLSRHVWVMAPATILAVACAVIGLGASNRWRDKLRLPLLLGVVLAWAMMVYGAWYGGETIYRQGTSVALIKYKSAGEDQDAKSAEVKPVLKVPKEPKIDLSAEGGQRYPNIVKYYMGSELQMHLIGAGVAFAAVMGALGLSLRRMTTLHAGEAADMAAAEQDMAIIGGPPRRVTDDVTVMRTLNPDALVDPEESRLPVARFWLLAMLILIGVAVGGYWVVSTSSFFKLEEFKSFWDSVKWSKGENRHFVHFLLGGTMIVTAFLFILCALLMPRRPLPLLVLGTLLIATIAAQVWIGVLLTFDTEMEGPLTHFSAPEKGTPEPHGSEAAPNQAEKDKEKKKEASMMESTRMVCGIA